MKKNTKKVTFEIDAKDYERYRLLETVAISNGRMLEFMKAFVWKMDDPKRKLTEEEWLQRADWMGLEPDMVAR